VWLLSRFCGISYEFFWGGPTLQGFGATSSSVLALHSWDSGHLSDLPHVSLVSGENLTFWVSGSLSLFLCCDEGSDALLSRA
jgi:hypothetical protein